MTSTDEDRRRGTDRKERNRNEPERATRTMGSVSHTNPVTGEPFGESQVFARGRTIIVDGGEAGPEDEEEKVSRIRDMDHTPREDAPDASVVYERGGEGEIDEDETDEADVLEAAEE